MSGDNYNEKSVDAVLSRIETKLDTALVEQQKHASAIESLNQFKYWMMGGAAVISFALHWLKETLTEK